MKNLERVSKASLEEISGGYVALGDELVDMIKSVDTAERLTQAEYARQRNVSRQRINRLVKDGKIPLHKGWIIPEEADRVLAAGSHASYDYIRKNLTPLADGLSGESAPVPHADRSLPDPALERDQRFQQILDGTLNIADVRHVEIRKWLDFEKAVEQKMENEKARRRLLDADEVQRVAFQTYRDVRDGILNLPDRLSGVLAAKAHQRCLEKLPPAILTQVDAALTDQDWQEIVYTVLNHEVQEVLSGLSNSMAATG